MGGPAPAPKPPGMPAMGGGALAGSAMQGLTKVKTALEMLQQALPMLPMGGEVHQDVMQSVAKLSKHLEKGPGDGGDKIQQLIEMIRNAKQNPGMAGMMPGGAPGAPPPPPGGAPPPMPGGAPPPPM